MSDLYANMPSKLCFIPEREIYWYSHMVTLKDPYTRIRPMLTYHLFLITTLSKVSYIYVPRAHSSYIAKPFRAKGPCVDHVTNYLSGLDNMHTYLAPLAAMVGRRCESLPASHITLRIAGLGEISII